jgi:hypothetical protein
VHTTTPETVATIQLHPSDEDKLVWRHAADGQYSTSNAYDLFFLANIRFPCASAIWKSKAPSRCKFFMWLVVHKRCLTADNLDRRGWPNCGSCPLCLREPETCKHLFTHCPFTTAAGSPLG